MSSKDYVCPADLRSVLLVREHLLSVGKAIDHALGAIPPAYRESAAPVLRHLAAQIEVIANAWAPGGCKVPAAKEGGS